MRLGIKFFSQWKILFKLSEIFFFLNFDRRWRPCKYVLFQTCFLSHFQITFGLVSKYQPTHLAFSLEVHSGKIIWKSEKNAYLIPIIRTSCAIFYRSLKLIIFLRLKKTFHRAKHFSPYLPLVRQLLDFVLNIKMCHSLLDTLYTPWRSVYVPYKVLRIIDYSLQKNFIAHFALF